MNTPLTGAWQSIRSNIPNYAVGREWLRFSDEDEHVWEIAQPEGQGRPSITRFTLEKKDSEFRFHPISKDSTTASEGWTVKIESMDPIEIAVTPQHGFTTIFRRTEKTPNSEGSVSP